MVKCNTNNCEKIANYGYEFKKPLACGIHRILEPNNLKMFNVVNKRCFCGRSQASFGLEQGKATHCFECKTTEMFDVKNKKCFCGIAKPYFGLEQGKATHCFECKTTEMFNVISKKCFCGISRPIFGLKQGKATHCYKCKTKAMFDVKNKKCFCGISAKFGLEKGKATHCSSCKTDKMFDVMHEKCRTEYCDTIISNPAYEGYCMRCFMYTFPDRPVARNYKTKETAMVEYVQQKYSHLNWVWDKKIVKGISLRRPDLFVDLDDMVLIIECQESHHKDDTEICVNRRMMELSLDVQHKPMLIIYFNPDSYIDENEKKIPSCWSVTKKTGIIKISNKDKWNERLDYLGDKIEYWLNKKTPKILEIDKLFHDKV